MGPAILFDPDGYNDYFSETDSLKEPAVLADGTSVQFPKGWTDEDADKWRKGMELQCPNIHNVLANPIIPASTWYNPER